MKLDIKAGEALMLRLSQLEKGTEQIAKKAIYEGAKIAATAMRSEISALPAEDERSTTRRGVTGKERTDLQKNLGISPIQNDGGVLNVKTGFDGYGHPTKKHPEGLPTIMVARSIQSGTSFRLPNRFSSRATMAAKGPAEAKISEVVLKEIQRYTKG